MALVDNTARTASGDCVAIAGGQLEEQAAVPENMGPSRIER